MTDTKVDAEAIIRQVEGRLNDMLAKGLSVQAVVEDYLDKADATTDPVLKAGYRALAEGDTGDAW